MDALCLTDAPARAFVAGGDDGLAAIDGFTDRLRGFWTNQCYPIGLFADSASGKLYCMNDWPFTLSVIDPSANSLLGTIPLSGYPQAVSFITADRKVYVALDNYQDETKAARPTPGCLNSSTRTRCRRRGSQPSSAASTASVAASTISVVDGVGDTVLADIDVDGHPTLLVFNATDDVLYAADPGSRQIQVISGKLDRVIDSLWVSEPPVCLLYNAARHRLYSIGSSEVSAITPGVPGADNYIDFGMSLQCFALNLSGTRLYAGGPDCDSVYVVDCVGESLARAIPAAGCPAALCYDAQHDRLYSTSTGEGGALSVINCEKSYLAATVAVPAWSLYYDPTSDAIYCLGESSVTVINGHDHSIVTTLMTGIYLTGIASAPGWARAYAVDYDDPYLFVIGKGQAGMGVQAAADVRATVVRGTLNWTGTLAVMYDMGGRRVADVHRGANDLTGLHPGVYFVKQNGVPRGTYGRKVVIAR